jgi:hypothetical protein
MDHMYITGLFPPSLKTNAILESDTQTNARYNLQNYYLSFVRNI